MLNLQPPFLDVGNLRIYTDDTDKDIFYYINQRPRLCFDENGKPALSIYAVVPESGVGKDNDSILETGLSVDVDLGILPEEMEAVNEAIKKNFGRNPKTLSPAPLHKGEVTFSMAQKEGSENAKNWYVTSGFRPSMIGTNRVSLAIRTTGEDAKRLVAALSSNQVMAIIHYDLEVVGITPVYKAYMRADMQMVYHHLQEKTKHSYIFYNSDVEKIVDDLKETNALVVEIEETDPDIKAEAMKSLMNELKTEVIKNFFTKQEMMTSDWSTTDKVGEGVSSFLSGIIHGIIPNYSYRKKEVDQSQLRSFEINLRQKNAKTFPISPQGQLKEIIDAANVSFNDCLSWVLLDDLQVKGQTVTFHLGGDIFESNFIKSVVTYCKVIDVATGQPIKEPETIVFDSDDKEEGKRLQKSFTYTRYRDKEYRYEYWSQIYIDSLPGVLPSPLVTKVTSEESNYIELNPAAFFKNFVIDLCLPDLSVLEHANMIIARINVFSDELEGKTLMNKDFLFDSNNADHKILSVFTDRELNLKFKIDYTFVVPNAKDIVMHVDGVQGQTITLVPNPFENQWSIKLDCMADWMTVDRVVIETRFRDVIQEDYVTGIFSFNEEKTEDTWNVACSLDTEKRKYEYYFRVFRKDGTNDEGGWIPVDGGNYLALDVDTMRSERTIQVKLKNPADFKKNDLKEIKVFLYPPDGSELSDSIVNADSVIEFKYPWRKGDSKVYSYKFTAKDQDKGTFFQLKKTKNDSDELLIEFIDND